jgi:phosphate starvation-inducible PhoH-like protein
LSTRARDANATPVVVEFDDNSLLPRLFGEYDRNLARIEQRLGVTLATRGNRIAVSGPAREVAIAREALMALYDRARRGRDLDMGEVDAAIRLATAEQDGAGRGKDEPVIVTPRRHIGARTPRQRDYIRALGTADLIFGLGPAGTGKTYLAVAMAVSQMMAGRIDRIILSRPAVEAGERLGFLPGDVREKVDPYLRPLYDALHDMLPADQVVRRLASGEIEIAPLAFMRGRTLSNAFVILDEGQNTTKVQMKMFLTRLGENSRMAVTGDLSQVDLPRGEESGLRHAISVLGEMPGLAQVTFTDADVVRHELVTRIVRAYDEEERRTAAKRSPT